MLMLGFLLYQLWYIYAIPYETMTHSIIHLGLAISVVLVAHMKASKRTGATIALAGMCIGTMLSTVYLFTHYSVILSNPSYPPLMALVAASVVTIFCFILVKWSFGLFLPVFVGLGIAYVLFGHLLPGDLSAPSTSLRRAITLLAADVTSPWGSYGSLLELSANYLFLFIAFGAILNAFGGLKFVVQLGNLAANVLKSGPAAIAVISSAFLGSVTGSSAANITVTGSFTIPMMKKAGYTPHQAAAIEAAASNGGQFLPPIMGATVFVMAAYTGIPYVDIMAAALIPALIYFVVLLIYAELNAVKIGIRKESYTTDLKQLVIDAPRFVVPFTFLVVLLLMGFSLMKVIYWSIIVVVAVGLVYNLKKETRISWNEVQNKISSGIITASNVAVILALIGVVVASIEITGLSLKLSMIFAELAGSNIFLLLVLTMVASLILGTGLPTPAAYVIVATVLSPLLVRAGVPLLQSHLFPLYFAVISHLTPPVGVGLILANNLAGADFWKTAREVFKAAFVVVFLPFFFVYSPEILMDYDSFFTFIAVVSAVMVAFFTFSIFINNQFAVKLIAVEKIIILTSTAFSLLFIVYDSLIYYFLCIILGFIPLYINVKRHSNRKLSSANPT